MDAAIWFEVVGYVASALIAVSILQQSILRLRIIGLVGSAVFVVYGLLIGAYPVVLMNALIAVIHVVYLRRLSTRVEEHLSFLPVEPGDPYLERFLDFHASDLERFFGPGAAVSPTSVVVFVLRDLVPAGLLIAERDGSDLRVVVDYAIPRYRDLVLGRHLYAHLGEAVDLGGIARIVTEAQHPAHLRYLSRVGFTQDVSGVLVRPIA